MSELKEKIKEAVNKHLDTAIALSKDLAEHPELPYQEFESSRKMAEILKEAGFEVTYPYAGYDTAYCAKLDNGDGPSVALLAEYDALPEIGHGCGHNLHGSLSVLSGLALMDLKINSKEHFMSLEHLPKKKTVQKLEWQNRESLMICQWQL